MLITTLCAAVQQQQLRCSANNDNNVAPGKSCAQPDLKRRKVSKILTEVANLKVANLKVANLKVANIQCRAITLLLAHGDMIMWWCDRMMKRPSRLPGYVFYVDKQIDGDANSRSSRRRRWTHLVGQGSCLRSRLKLNPISEATSRHFSEIFSQFDILLSRERKRDDTPQALKRSHFQLLRREREFLSFSMGTNYSTKTIRLKERNSRSCLKSWKWLQGTKQVFIAVVAKNTILTCHDTTQSRQHSAHSSCSCSCAWPTNFEKLAQLYLPPFPSLNWPASNETASHENAIGATQMQNKQRIRWDLNKGHVSNISN